MSQFMVKSLEELEAYLVEECQRSECKFLSDNQNNNFPLTRKALEDTRRIHIDKPVTTYVQNLNDRRPRRCTCTPSTLSITVDHERDLWKKGVLGIDECFALLRTFHFYVSKCFGICGRRKHHALQLDHFQFDQDLEGSYVYFQGNFNPKEVGIENAVTDIKHYNDPDNPRSFYKIMRSYIDAFPKNGNGKFYEKLCETTVGG